MKSFQLLAEGKRMKEVGRILKITHRTVAFHKYRVKDALNAKSNSEFFQYAIKHLLIAA
ncbi:MAG TPA: LuxR C-terminal-related transcriptional regulator [Terriglobales bacterium]|nr:LuxR C-terminal-related transcriptional regulator [Terriglobales bacterium]